MIINLIGIMVSVFTTNYILIDFLITIYPFKDIYTDKSPIKTLLLPFISFSILIIICNYYSSPTLNLISNILIFNIISYKYFHSSSLRYMFLMNTFFLIILILVDALVSLGIDLTLSHILINNINPLLYNFLKTTIFSIVILCSFSFIKSFFKVNSKIMDIKQNFVLSIFLPFFSILVPYIIIILDNVLNTAFTNYISLFISLGLIFLNVYLIKLYEYLYKNNSLKNQLEILKEQSKMQLSYYESLSNKQIELKHYIHDVKRHIQTIQNLYATNQSELADQYIFDLYGVLQKFQYYFTSENKVLEILINDKIRKAKELNIEVSAIDNTISNLSFIKNIDLVLILSNLIDNAIDAAVECDEKYININIDNHYQLVYITIQNPYK